MIFNLVQDFADVLAAMPNAHPRHRILKLLDEAVRRDVHFIARRAQDYPQALFQCLWNSCWWYDAPEAAAYYDLSNRTNSERLPWEWPTANRIATLLERWRAQREQRLPGFL